MRVMPEVMEQWHDIHTWLRSVPQDRRAAFALACAEHLLLSTPSSLEPQLTGALEAGWSAVVGGDVEALVAYDHLVALPDVDTYKVAAIAYALGAVAGLPEDAWWAVSRCIDAAFDRVPYADDITVFRPLETDAASPEVQRELRWQLQILSVIESTDALTDLVARLRALT